MWQKGSIYKTAWTAVRSKTQLHCLYLKHITKKSIPNKQNQTNEQNEKPTHVHAPRNPKHN